MRSAPARVARTALARLPGVVWLTVAALAGPNTAIADPGCAGIHFEGAAGGRADRALVCSGMRKATSFFRAHGIEFAGPTRLRIHDGDLERYANHIGVYDPAAGRVDLLSLARSKRLCADEVPFDVEMGPALYRSFVVHELAHAVVDQQAGAPPAPLVHEYLAYVAQIATMEPVLRAEVLRRNPLPAFARAEEMSWTYYELDPSAFAVKAYRHYLAQPDRTRLVRDLVQRGSVGFGLGQVPADRDRGAEQPEQGSAEQDPGQRQRVHQRE